MMDGESVDKDWKNMKKNIDNSYCKANDVIP